MPRAAVGTDAGAVSALSTGEDFAMGDRCRVIAEVASLQIAKEIRRPDNQLELTVEELDEEVAKMLRADNPVAPRGLVRYIQKERQYKPEAMILQTISHFATDGWLIHEETEEARKQLELVKFEAEADKAFEAAKAEHAGGDNFDDSKDLRNQFNFSERAAQTSSLYPKDKVTITEPPPTLNISGTCCQSEIYEEYIKDQARIEEQERLAKLKQAAKKGQVAKQEDELDKRHDGASLDVMASHELLEAARVLERMVNQNTYDDIAMEFKYWDDASDQFKQKEGTLLPLWHFATERARKKTVTSIAWSPTYEDMFAIGFGSFEFTRPTAGLICLFSLANPTYPEFTLTTAAGVCAVDFHPQFSNLLAVGLYDGTVMVFDVARRKNEPILTSTVDSGTHREPVWQVRWEAAQPLRFYSTSADGNVLLWALSKASLEPELGKLLCVEDADDDAAQVSGGCCFDFNEQQQDVYIVGTEEGTVHKCSKAYSGRYLASYVGHTMAVYSVAWNSMHEDIFLSASADWTVRLWNSARAEDGSIMTFDMHASVSDVAWSPFSATVFAVCTTDGKVSVFDLSESPHEPICQQKVVRKAKLTRLAFNRKHPLLLVGDDRGCVTSLKLSPNLRKHCAAEGGKSVALLEKAKLERVLDVALKSRPKPVHGK